MAEIIAFAAILVFLLALLMWDKRLIAWTFVLALLAEVVQHATATDEHPWVGGLHPVSGVAILGISAYLAHQAWAHSGRVRGGRLRMNRHSSGAKDI